MGVRGGTLSWTDGHRRPEQSHSDRSNMRNLRRKTPARPPDLKPRLPCLISLYILCFCVGYLTQFLQFCTNKNWNIFRLYFEVTFPLVVISGENVIYGDKPPQILFHGLNSDISLRGNNRSCVSLSLHTRFCSYFQPANAELGISRKSFPFSPLIYYNVPLLSGTCAGR